MGAGRFEYLQSKITCLASPKAPGSQSKDLATSHSDSGAGGRKSFHGMGGKIQ